MRRGSVTAVVATFVATTAVLSGCGDDGEEAAAPLPPHVPLETTTTTEPTTTTSTTKGLGPAPDVPQAEHLIQLAKNQMRVAGSVTIEGTLQSKEGPAKLHAEGSSGGDDGKAGGKSRTVLEVKGGKIEMIIVGDSRWIKADKTYTREAMPYDSPMRKYAGTWVRLPDGDESIESFRPYHLLRGRFFGENLTTWDAKTSDVTAQTLRGRWAFRITVRPGTGGQKMPIEWWTSPDTQQPRTEMLAFGTYPTRSELHFTKWGKSNEDWSAPPGAKVIKDEDSPLGDNLLDR